MRAPEVPPGAPPAAAPPPAGSWLSAHLPLTGDHYGAPADRLLFRGVEPLVRRALGEGLAESWFFLRFNQPSSHLRLRLRVPASASVRTVGKRVRELGEGCLRAAGDEGEAALAGFAWVPYEPEYDRYGGPAGVALAEDLFHRSSETALALLRKVEAGDRPARLGKAMLAMLVLIYGYAPERASASTFSRAYGHGYLRSLVPDPSLQERWLATFEAGFGRQADGLSRYLEAAWEALDAGSELTSELDLYRRWAGSHRGRLKGAWEAGSLVSAGEPYATWEQCWSRIVPSYLHMMNNRLGVNLQEESYLSVLIDWTLRRSAGVPSHS